MTTQNYVCSECKRSWDSKPVGWRVRSNLCNACSDRKLDYARKGYTPATRRFGTWWTEAELQVLMNAIGSASPKWIASKLGRTQRSVLARAKREGVKIRRWAILESGMSTGDVVKELGVSIHTVRIWLNRGWLKAKRVHGIHTINQEDMTVFLRNIGWRLTCLHPTLPWKELIADIAKDERPNVINRKELLSILVIGTNLVTTWIKKHNFPQPLPGEGVYYGGQWFRRDDIKQWFDNHPQFWSTAAVRAGFVEEWRFNQDAFCAFEGCRNHRHALSYCSNHYHLSIKYPHKYPPQRRRIYKGRKSD